MDQPVQEMTPAQLLEEFRGKLMFIGSLDPSQKRRDETRRADLLEQEILRRMAW